MPGFLQRMIALAAALASLPLIGGLCLWIKLDSPGPAIYRASRVGTGGKLFTCYKLRTMRVEIGGSRVSVSDDQRTTRVGKILRSARLDELPQLWNVVGGSMLLVGPRPEDPAFVDWKNDIHRSVFTATPGITGLTQLAFMNEAEELNAVDSEVKYRERILPRKLVLDQRYLERRSFRLDVWILWRTMFSLGRIRRRGDRPPVGRIGA